MPATKKSEATKVIEFFENADHHAMKITHDIVSGIVKRRMKAATIAQAEKLGALLDAPEIVPHDPSV